MNRRAAIGVVVVGVPLALSLMACARPHPSPAYPGGHSFGVSTTAKSSPAQHHSTSPSSSKSRPGSTPTKPCSTPSQPTNHRGSAAPVKTPPPVAVQPTIPSLVPVVAMAVPASGGVGTPLSTTATSSSPGLLPNTGTNDLGELLGVGSGLVLAGAGMLRIRRVR